MSDHEKPSKSKEELERQIARNDEIIKANAKLIKAFSENIEALYDLWKALRDREESED